VIKADRKRAHTHTHTHTHSQRSLGKDEEQCKTRRGFPEMHRPVQSQHGARHRTLLRAVWKQTHPIASTIQPM